MNNTNHTLNQAALVYVTHEAAEIEKLDIAENGEWGRSFLEGVKIAPPNAASPPAHLSLLDELNSLDRAA